MTFLHSIDWILLFFRFSVSSNQERVWSHILHRLLPSRAIQLCCHKCHKGRVTVLHRESIFEVPQRSNNSFTQVRYIGGTCTTKVKTYPFYPDEVYLEYHKGRIIVLSRKVYLEDYKSQITVLYMTVYFGYHKGKISVLSM